MCDHVDKFIKIEVCPNFMKNAPHVAGYFWTYSMKIFNHWNKTVQIVQKQIEVIDENGVRHIFQSDGILGDMVVLQPNEEIEYTSGIPLFAASGVAVGKYLMHSETGEEIFVDIPAFSLDSPYSKKSIH